MVAIKLCLEQLEPKPNDLKDVDKRLSWCNQVQSVRPVIHVLNTLSTKPSKKQNIVGNSAARFHDQLFGDQFARNLRECRCVVNQSSFLRS